jgi:molybdate transport system regulatory protein
MKLWIITGSSSGVGKSTLAHELAVLLPQTLVIKVGHGTHRRGKSPNYFTDSFEAVEFIESQKSHYQHMIVESNRLIGKIRADIIIFLDSYEGDRRFDVSKLKARAGIRLGKSANEEQWFDELAKVNIPLAFRGRIIDVLKSQNEYLVSNRLDLRTKIWFTKDGLIVFGEGLAKLLYGVEEHGSLSKAAKAYGVSYRHAWGDLKRAEERLGFALLDRRTGGQKGGGAELTEPARKLLRIYESLKRRLIRQGDAWFEKLISDLQK